MRTTPADRIADFTARGWWGEDTLTSIFDQAVIDCPDRLALVDQFNRSDFTGTDPQRLTFTEIASRVENLAAIIHSHGIGRDDIVVIQLPNIVELAMIYIVLARLGVIVSPVPVQYGVHELAKIQDELQASAYISITRFQGQQSGGRAPGGVSRGMQVFCFRRRRTGWCRRPGRCQAFGRGTRVAQNVS